MKELMLGNEAVARGVYESGCTLVFSYPGTPSTEITEYAAQYADIYCEWAPNEKVALEAGIGASIQGKRALCAMKHVGLNVAADPLFTASYTGVRAGLVIAVADDPGMFSSQNEQDTRRMAAAARVPVLEPSTSAECRDFVKLAFEISERFDTPVILRLTTRVAHTRSIVELGEKTEAEKKSYEKQPQKYVMVPANAKVRRTSVEKREEELAEYFSTIPENFIEGSGSRGIITSGISYLYTKEALGEDVKLLKLSASFPLPEKLIREFASTVDEVYVIEELGPCLEERVKLCGVDVKPLGLLQGGELSAQMIGAAFGKTVPHSASLSETLPNRPPVMCPGCPHRGVFYLLKKLGLFVSGDIGCYTLGSAPPLSAIDTTICMGASISALHGAIKADNSLAGRAVAVIGDSTFMHSGITGLADVVYNGSAATVIILDNSITGMTGHQDNPCTGKNCKGEPAYAVDLVSLCRALGVGRVRVCDPNDLAGSEKAIKEELAQNEASVIIMRRPCALLKTARTAPPFVIKDCRGCKNCLKVGCPAISFDGSRANIDKALCSGCGLCAQLCAFGAIEGSEAQ